MDHGSPLIAHVGLADCKRASRWPARLDATQSVTGLVLALFMWDHVFFVSSILFGKDAMWTVTISFSADRIRGPVSVVVATIVALLVTHALLAVRKFPVSYRQYQTFRGPFRRERGMNDPAVRPITFTRSSGALRKLTLRILRYNPQDPASVPHLQSYELEEAEGMTLFIALSEIREKVDASLQFDFVCRAGIGGSCAMIIDGRPGFACRTLTKNLGAQITLAPLPVFELIADLSVNTGCMSLLGCHDVCPKQLPLATQLAFVRRRMVAVGWK